MLTCGVIETSSIKVVPAVNQLEPGAVSLTPFEAVAGNRHDDVVVPPWRYIQFEYSMRLLSEGFFGQDVTIPALTVTYNLQSPGAGNTEGRDQTYLLPRCRCACSRSCRRRARTSATSRARRLPMSNRAAPRHGGSRRRVDRLCVCRRARGAGARPAGRPVPRARSEGRPSAAAAGGPAWRAHARCGGEKRRRA